MGHGHELSCVLCQRADETKITGALSTKDQVTAHQNCLLFSSGIYCRNSPQFDDLFGFSVEDVKVEVRRGSKLHCNKCKKRGATAGCEVKRCKRSYHYPCAVQEGAKIFEDAEEGNYGLYCINHCQQIQENGSSVNGCTSSLTKTQRASSPSEAGPSKVFCFTCEKTEGNISLESFSNSIMMSYCDKHAPLSRKRNADGESTAAGSSLYKCSKRTLSLDDKQEGTPSKPWKRRISDDSVHSGESNCNADMEIFAPLESDLDESANSVQESHTGHQFVRGNNDISCSTPTGNQLVGGRDGNASENETIIYSDAESESLLAPAAAESRPPSATAGRPAEAFSPRRGPVHSSGGPRPSPERPEHSAGPAEAIRVPPLSAPPSPGVPTSDPEPSMDPRSFWKNCNTAGCTQAIFTDFMNEMNDISSRIQSEQASPEDYSLALRVIEASGKLGHLVFKQQKELQRKQMELQKAAAAMGNIISALR